MRIKSILSKTIAVFFLIFTLLYTPAFAQSASTTETTTPDEFVLEDNRTLTHEGNAQLVDNISDNKNLQFITVESKNGNIFYFVIDKAGTSNNVYFLNTVDESDLAALIEDGEFEYNTGENTESPSNPADDNNYVNNTVDNQTEIPEPEKQGNSAVLYIILVVVAIVGIGGYYYKIVLPKKKLNQADDLEDFEFETPEVENVINEDEDLQETEDNLQ